MQMYLALSAVEPQIFIFMALTKEKKESVIKDLRAKLEKSSIAVFVNFHGLNTKDASILRRELRSEEINYKVAKKTLINKVLGGFGLQGEKMTLEGEVGVVFGHGDVIIPPKILSSFIKKQKTMKILGGVFDGGYIDSAAVAALATIPSRDVLLGQLVYVINAPLQGMVGALSGVIRNLTSVLSQIKK